MSVHVNDCTVILWSPFRGFRAECWNIPPIFFPTWIVGTLYLEDHTVLLGRLNQHPWSLRKARDLFKEVNRLLCLLDSMEFEKGADFVSIVDQIESIIGPSAVLRWVWHPEVVGLGHEEVEHADSEV